MTISKRCDVPSCFLFVVVAGVCACMHACVCVREPVVCFCFEDGITCVKYENLRQYLRRRSETPGTFYMPF